jgi:pyroglutamyl-peptidase
MSVTVLVTGFGPFPGAPFNPTAHLVRRMARRQSTNECRRITHVFHVSYAAVAAELPKLIAQHRPDVVLMFGLAARADTVRIETRAVNARSLLFPDADGAWPAGRTIDPHAPHARAGRAPHRGLLAAARASGVPARLSRDAGRYLCNFAFWLALEALPDPPVIVQFVHVPLVRTAPIPRPRTQRRPSLSDLERVAEAMLCVLATAARDKRSRTPRAIPFTPTVKAQAEPSQAVAEPAERRQA